MFTKSIAPALLIVSTALLTGCGNSQLTTGSIPMDYRERHPIVLTDVQTALDIPVGANDSRMTIGMRDTVKGFAQNFANSSAGFMQIQVPQGSVNAGAAAHMAGDIRKTLQTAGIRGDRIVMARYSAGGHNDAAPIRLSFIATKAVTGACGEWPEDLSDNTFGNRNWYNFGCASQNNLAAQLESPTDLLGPRAQTPIDAVQRSKVISTYRGTNTNSTTITINSN